MLQYFIWIKCRQTGEQVQQKGNLLWKYVIYWETPKDYVASSTRAAVIVYFCTQKDVFLIIFAFFLLLLLLLLGKVFIEVKNGESCFCLCGWKIRTLIYPFNFYRTSYVTLFPIFSERYASVDFRKSYFRVLNHSKMVNSNLNIFSHITVV